MIYIINEVDGTKPQVTVLEEFEDPHIEALWLKIVIENIKFIVGGVYRAPTPDPRPSQSDSKLFSIIEQVSTQETPVMIFGDFNLPTINWNDDGPTPKTDIEREFVNMFNNTNLTQKIKKPTRFGGGQRPNILGLVLINEEDVITPHIPRPPIGRSDHVIITTQTQFRANRDVRQTKSDTRRLN